MDSMYTYLHKTPSKTSRKEPKLQNTLTFAYIINLVKKK